MITITPRAPLLWFYGTSIVVGYLMPNPFLYKKSVLFQTIQVSIIHKFKVKNSSNLDDSVLFGLTHRYDPIRYYHSRPDRLGTDGNEGLLQIPQRSSITGTSPSYCWVSCPGYWFEESCSSAEMQSVYPTATTGWTSTCLRIIHTYLFKNMRRKNRPLYIYIYIYIYIY